MSSFELRTLESLRSLRSQSSWAQNALTAVFASCCKDDSAVPSPDRQETQSLLPPRCHRVLHFGGSDFGRGYILRVLAEAGCQLVLADPAPSLVYPLSEVKKYKVRQVGQGMPKCTEVELEDVIFMFSDETVDQICRADLITTSIGFNNMGALVDVLVKGLRERRHRMESQGTVEDGLFDEGVLNILVCEELPGSKSLLQKSLHDACANFPGLNEWLEENVGIVECVVDCIVPWRELQDKIEPFEVVTEDYGEWFVSAQDVKDLSGFNIPGVQVTPRIQAYAERHLLTVQCGQTIAAYYGHLLGHKFIRNAMEQDEIAQVVRGAMMETATILCRRYGFSNNEHLEYIERTMCRLENNELRDSVTRVAKRPLRNLEPGACLIRPLHFACSLGLEFKCLAAGAAAGLLYDSPDEADCRLMKAWLQREGLLRGIQHLTGLNDERSLRMVASSLTTLESRAYERRKAARKYPTFAESAYSAVISAQS